MNTTTSIHEKRQQVRRLLDDSNPADAPTAYYALFHPAARSSLVTRVNGDGRVQGFLGQFQTGIDLFRPLITLACHDAEIAADLMAEALTLGRPYILFANLNQLPLVGGSLRVDQHRTLEIFRLNVGRFQPEINVLVQCTQAPDGTPRCAIRSGEQGAVAGVNWQSPAFAEIYVHTDPGARQRGWGTSVAAAVTQAVLAEGRVPLYLVEPDNDASRQLAASLGFVDTGARQVYADVVYMGHPRAGESGRR
jgi:hypothetical protein